MRLALPLLLALAACGPVPGTADTSTPTDAADVLEDRPALDAPEDVAVSDTSAPETTLDAPVSDALRCTDDNDRDGHVSRECGGDDCDDNNARVHPGQLPHCDRELVDSNCDGTADAQQALLRNMRCVREYPTIPGGGSSSSAGILCTTSSAMPSCRACRSQGTTTQCLCWGTGTTQSEPCAP